MCTALLACWRLLNSQIIADRFICLLVDCVGLQVLKVLRGHTDWVFTVAISTDGAKILSGSSDNTARVWSMETGKVPVSLLD